MQTALWLILGLVLGGAFLAFARQQGPGERRVLAVGLVAAAVIYAGFAIGGAEPTWIGIEVAGILAYGVFAWLGLHRSILWLAAGWALHVAWDAGLHLHGAGASFTPAWYVPLCISFDLLVATYVVLRYRRVSSTVEAA